MNHEATPPTTPPDYGNPENSDPLILCQKLALMEEIKSLNTQIERQDQKLNHDPTLIHKMHEYNYLKDATFMLCDAISNIKRTSAKEIFEEFEIKDLDQGRWLGKSKFS